MRFENSLKRSVPAIIVRLVSQDPESQVRRVGWRISVLELSYENQPESTRQVTHMNMKSWPDGSVPDAHSHWGPPEKRLLDFITKAKDLNDRLSSAQAALSPVMTHCSVGRGRTGTLIASAMLIEVADFARHVDLHEKVTTSQRMDGDPLPEFDVKNHGKEFPTIDVVGLFWDSLRAQRRLMLEERQLGLVLACATRYSAQASKPAVIDQPATDQYYRAGDEQPISKVFGDTYVKLSKRDHKTFHPDQPQGIHNCRFCHLVLINGNDHPLASTHAYDPSCDLCKAVHSSEVLYEDEHFAVIEDIAPASPLHLLCIPKRHVHSPVSFTETGEDLHEHEKDTLEYYDALVSFARKSFAEEAKRRGYQFGPSTVLTGLHVSPTTSVDHFHLQILLVLTPSLVRKLENEAKSSGSRTEKLRKMKKKYHTKFVPSLIHRGVGAAPDESKILPSDPSSLLVLRGFAFFVLAARFRAIIEHSLLRVELVGHNVFEKEEERWTRREIGLVEYPIQ
ncbi:phosphatases II [Pseudohyphozyma bogoriensis]|nr:phosphatases II [Pseudohyphozyma bogoriensis]